MNGNIERIRHSDACEPWGYVAPVVAAVMTRATGVRHIYLIVNINCAYAWMIPIGPAGGQNSFLISQLVE